MKYTEYLEKIKGFSWKTVEVYSKYAHMLETHEKDYKKFLVSLPNYSQNTKRLIISSIICYYKFLNDDRWRELELPKREILVRDYVTYEEYRDILKKINVRTKLSIQKRLIVRLLFETGIRSSELLQIRVQDITSNEIKIFGKGRRQRIVKISEWLLDELNTYMADKTNEIFTFKYKNLYSKIRTINSKRKITPHMFRRGYAKYCFENGISIYDISLSMGHSSIETTSKYINRSSDDVEIYKIF